MSIACESSSATVKCNLSLARDLFIEVDLFWHRLSARHLYDRKHVIIESIHTRNGKAAIEMQNPLQRRIIRPPAPKFDKRHFSHS